MAWSSLLRPNSALATIPKLAAPLRQQVLDELRQSIIAGRLSPGERLVERELISMMGVSRTVIREALRQLESEGLVAIVPNKGPIVRALTVEEARDLYAIRAVLEGLAARLFVEQADDHQIAGLEKAFAFLQTAYESADADKMLEAKNTFYEALFEGAKSATLSTMIGMLHGRIWRWRALGLTHPSRSRQRAQESTNNLLGLVHAIRARDAALAEKIIRDEVSKAAEEVHRLLRDGAVQAPGKKPDAS
jgi:DNA-binding GntR family transcriptional regulator